MTKSKKHSSVKSRKQAVAIIMGSKTDLPQMSEATAVLEDFGIKVHVEIVSAHRTPVGMVEFAQNAHEKYDVIIAGAGGAAHLPGMVASLTPLPVIGVPVTVNSLKGLDALLSIVQMPKGVPVATVAVDNAHNAGLLALRILGISNPVLMKKLFKHAEAQRTKVKIMNKALKAERKKIKKKS